MHIVTKLTGGQGFMPDCCKSNQKAAEAFGQDIMDRYGNTEYFDAEVAEHYQAESWEKRLICWLRAFPQR